jgi:glycosyltransferase involved in cell wall biosynthesis
VREGAVDVVIPVFNGERYIENCIYSVQQQSLPAARIIVADDGSTDRTVEIVTSLQQADSRITLLKLPHAGVSAARNAGIAASSAPYIGFLDADDLWLPEKLAHQFAAFEAGGREVGFAHSSYFFINEESTALPELRVYPPKLSGDIFLPLLLEGYVLSGSASSVVVRREILDKAGYFDERLFHGEDWDLWIRLAHISHVAFTPEAVVGIRVHDQSAQRRNIPGRSLRFFRQQLLVYAKWEGHLFGDPNFKASLRRRALEAVMPLWRSPLELVSFYRAMAQSQKIIENTLFRSFPDYVFSLSRCLMVVLWRRLRRKVSLHEQ